jgi:uncharacterized membrane protein
MPGVTTIQAGAHGICTLHIDGTQAEREANAAFIVRACNNHDPLLAVAEGLVELDDMVTEWWESANRDKNECAEALSPIITKARAAIAEVTK